MMTSNYVQFLARCGEKVIAPVQCLTCYSKRGAIPKRYGKVKWFNTRKGYGFIVTGNDQEVFFHQNQLYGGNGATPQEGQDAWFHVRYAFKGPEALNVELAHE
jgi:CspA family cold shock protein